MILSHNHRVILCHLLESTKCYRKVAGAVDDCHFPIAYLNSNLQTRSQSVLPSVIALPQVYEGQLILFWSPPDTRRQLWHTHTTTRPTLSKCPTMTFTNISRVLFSLQSENLPQSETRGTLLRVACAPPSFELRRMLRMLVLTIDSVVDRPQPTILGTRRPSVRWSMKSSPGGISLAWTGSRMIQMTTTKTQQ